jgi:hypothetical protein
MAGRAEFVGEYWRAGAQVPETAGITMAMSAPVECAV